MANMLYVSFCKRRTRTWERGQPGARSDDQACGVCCTLSIDPAFCWVRAIAPLPAMQAANGKMCAPRDARMPASFSGHMRTFVAIPGDLRPQGRARACAHSWRRAPPGTCACLRSWRHERAPAPFQPCKACRLSILSPSSPSHIPCPYGDLPGNGVAPALGRLSVIP